MGFSRQEYWSGLPCLPSGDLPNPESELASLLSPALAGGFFTTSTTWDAQILSKMQKVPRKRSSVWGHEAGTLSYKVRVAWKQGPRG